MDVDSIPIGVDFVEFLEGWVEQCDIMLALIGAGWAEGIDPKTGRRRLENPDDFVRIEVRKGLSRGIPVVPIMLDGATIPDAGQLPDDLQQLMRRNAEFIDHRTVETDVERLIRKLRLADRPAQTAPANPAVAPARVVSAGDRMRAEGRIEVGTKFIQGARGGWLKSGPGETKLSRSKSAMTQVRWGWIGAIATGALIITYIGAHYIGIPVPWPAPLPEEENVIAANAEAKRLSITPASGQSFRDRLANGQPCEQCPEMVLAPAGIFTMGSPPSEPARALGEAQVPVAIAQSFAVGKFAVTFDQWDACVADGGCNGYRPSDQGWGRGNRPVINVNWNDASAYAVWLSRKTGKTYRLLSEAEREYVTRAGTRTPFWWGSSISPNQANCNYTYAGGPKGEYRQRTVPVDGFEANHWGLFNVHGNVWDWTEDCWNDSNQPGNGNARTTGDCSRRVVRGGSWSSFPRNLRAAFRDGFTSDARYDDVGFRLARTLSP
jgi:formylglycine-generating enzyme required for sulfatase activity